MSACTTCGHPLDTHSGPISGFCPRLDSEPLYRVPGSMSTDEKREQQIPQAEVDAFTRAWDAKRREIGRGIADKGTKTRAGLAAAYALRDAAQTYADSRHHIAAELKALAGLTAGRSSQHITAVMYERARVLDEQPPTSPNEEQRYTLDEMRTRLAIELRALASLTQGRSAKSIIHAMRARAETLDTPGYFDGEMPAPTAPETYTAQEVRDIVLLELNALARQLAQPIKERPAQIVNARLAVILALRRDEYPKRATDAPETTLSGLDERFHAEQAERTSHISATEMPKTGDVTYDQRLHHLTRIENASPGPIVAQHIEWLRTSLRIDHEHAAKRASGSITTPTPTVNQDGNAPGSKYQNTLQDRLRAAIALISSPAGAGLEPSQSQMVKVIQEARDALMAQMQQDDITDEQIYAERQHQMDLGFSAVHDDDHGLRHLLLWAVQYGKQHKSVESLALIRAALESMARKGLDL